MKHIDRPQPPHGEKAMPPELRRGENLFVFSLPDGRRRAANRKCLQLSVIINPPMRTHYIFCYTFISSPVKFHTSFI